MTQQSQPGVARLTVETYAVRLATLGLMAISAVLQARLLGPEGKGLLAAALSWSALIGGIALLGSDSAVIYFVARSAQHTLWTMRAGLMYAVGIALVALVLSGIQVDALMDRRLMLSVALLTPVFVLTTLLNAICVGLNRIRLTNVINAVSTLLYVLALAVLYVAGVDRAELVIATVLGVQVAMLIVLAATLRRTETAECIAPPLTAFARYSLQSFRGNLAGLLFLRSSLVIISGTASIAQTGIYSIAVVFADMALMLPNTLINVLLPRLAGHNPASVALRVAAAARSAFAGALGLGLLLGSSAFVLVPAGFGEAFRPAAAVAFVLCIGAALSTPGMVLSLYFNALEQPGTPATAAWIGCGILIAASLALAPLFGALGAAVAVVVARTMTTLVMVVRFCHASRLSWRTLLLFQTTDWTSGERRIHAIYEQIVRFRRA
ncbi:MAG: polysaccharide biosynthesis C-terminal domain-containing protein [Roseiflexaceae bacterium]|nr:polysaccharide biosynthesis C-terminal domain-containing protein [Roseiflexaceae bacterium]